MGIKISEATAVGSATGIELLPASVSDAPRRVSVAQVKDYILAAAAAVTPASGVSAGNGIFILQDGALKPVDIDAVTQRAIDIVWAKSTEATPAGSGVVPLKEGSTEKTLTLANLAAYIQGVIRAAILNPDTLDAAGATSSVDTFVVGQSGVAKKIELSGVQTAVLAGLKDFVSGLAVVTSAADADELYVIQGGVSRKVTYAKLKEGLGLSGYVIAPAGTVENKVPQWDSVSKTLKEGLALRQDVRADGNTDDDTLVSETGMRAAIDAVSDALITWDNLVTSPEKATPVDDDLLVIGDSADASAAKRIKVVDLWNNLFLDKIPAQQLTKLAGVMFSDALTAYTLVLSDAGKFIRLANANPITVTVPPDASVAFPIGSFVEIEQAGAGIITVAEGSGVTINSKDDGDETDGQHSTVRLVKVASDTWTLIGGVTNV